MSTWIINRLLVKSDPARLREFLDAVKSEGQPFDFDLLVPVPELITHVSYGFMTIDGQEVEQWYTTDDGHHRLFTPQEEQELEQLGYRRWGGWFLANWGTNRNACDIQLDESSVHSGYVVIQFETAWNPPWPILRRLQDMFSDLGFACRWFSEDESFYRYHPSVSLAIGRVKREGSAGQHITTTLYMTKDNCGDFFLETQTATEMIAGEHRVRTMIETMSEAEAHSWLLSPDVKLLALIYPEIPEREPPRTKP
jgi:hypothetical protein